MPRSLSLWLWMFCWRQTQPAEWASAGLPLHLAILAIPRWSGLEAAKRTESGEIAMKLTSTATRLYSVFVALIKDRPTTGPLVGWAE